MSHMKAFPWLIPVLLLLSWTVGAQGGTTDTSKALNQLFDDYFERSLELNPLQATFIGDHRYDDRLTNSISPAHLALALDVERRYLDAALKFDPQSLSAADRLSWEIFVGERRTAIAGSAFRSEWLPLDQMSGLPMLMAVLGSATNAQPFDSVGDYDEFLARMDDYVVWSDQAIANMREGIRHKVVQPRVVMEKVQGQLAELIVTDPTKSLYYQPVTKFPDSFSAADRARLEKDYRVAIADRITPSYRRLHDFIRDEYLKQARASVAWTDLPDGTKWYAYLVKFYTTTDYTPDYIHDLGLNEVARIRAEMEQVMQQVGFRGDLPAFFRHLQDDPQVLFRQCRRTAGRLPGTETEDRCASAAVLF